MKTKLAPKQRPVAIKKLRVPTRSSFSVTFYIPKGKKQTTGKISIMCRISVNGDMTTFFTKMHTQLDRWSAEDRRTVGITKEEKDINETLEELRSMIKRKYHECINNGEPVNARVLKNSILCVDDKCITLLPLCDKFLEDYYLVYKSGGVVKDTYQRYVYTRRCLHEYMKMRYNIDDISIKSISHSFIKEFDLWLRNHKNICNNSACKLVKHFRTMFNLALNNGWIHADPFSTYKVQYERVDRGYLTQEELARLTQREFNSPRLTMVRDMFLFSCYTGLAYTDVANLTFEDIQVDAEGRQRIITKRQKTKVGVTIPLLDIPRMIVEKYSKSKRRSGREEKLLPIYSNQKCNDYLKEIGALCDINKELTYHLARHTFATTITLANGMPIETVSRLLGHTSIKTTQIYARITDTKIGADMDILSEKLNSKTIR